MLTCGIILLSVIKTYAIIVAGGQGIRMGTAIPKQFLDLDGKPVLYHTIKAFLDTIPEINIILVLPENQISYAQMILQSFSERIDITIVAGGATRFESVQNGMADLVADDSIIFVHDGVRPLVSVDLIKRCYNAALEKGNAIPAITATDSMRILKHNIAHAIDRNGIRIIQTPQTFKASILLPAMQQSYQDSFTDEATVVESFGIKINLVEGEKSNIKITTPEDLLIAETLIRAKKTL